MKEKRPAYIIKDFHTQMRKIRLYKNFRYQADISKQLNITRQVYSLWEKGNRMPTITQLASLANIFEVDINYFFIADADPKDYDMNIETLRKKMGKSFSAETEKDYKLMPFVETVVSRQIFKCLDRCKRIKGSYTINVFEDSGVTRALLHYSIRNPGILNIVEAASFSVEAMETFRNSLLVVFDNADRLPEETLKLIFDAFLGEFIGSIVLVGKNIKHLLQNYCLLERVANSFTADCITTGDFNNIIRAALPDAADNIINLLRMETGVRLKNLCEILKKIDEQQTTDPEFELSPGFILELCS